jgi:hypothetical protein
MTKNGGFSRKNDAEAGQDLQVCAEFLCSVDTTARNRGHKLVEKRGQELRRRGELQDRHQSVFIQFFLRGIVAT